MLRCYTDLIKLKTMEERFEYLKLNGKVGEEVFGYMRYLNQRFYHEADWLDVKDQVVLRDKGCDLGMPGWEIQGHVYVHHMNPVTVEQLLAKDPIALDPEYLITCSYNMHQAITWGNALLIPRPIAERRPGDTCPWKIRE